MEEQKLTEKNVINQNDTPKKKYKIKKILKNLLALVLVAVISVAGTWAYLNKKSERIPNTFVGSNGLDLLLKEEKYDKQKTKKYSPGLAYDKDPVLYNITNDGNTVYYEWVAIRLDYIINVNTNSTGLAPGVVSRQAIMGLTDPNNGIIESIDFDIDNTTGNWVRLDLGANVTYEIYVYKYPLINSTKTTYTDTTNTSNNATQATSGVSGSRTSPLFNQVKIFEQKSLSNHGYADDKLPKFTISVLGAAIKVEDEINIAKFDITSLGANPTESETKTYNASIKIKNALVDLLDDQALNVDQNHYDTTQ